MAARELLVSDRSRPRGAPFLGAQGVDVGSRHRRENPAGCRCMQATFGRGVCVERMGYVELCKSAGTTEDAGNNGPGFTQSHQARARTSVRSSTRRRVMTRHVCSHSATTARSGTQQSTPTIPASAQPAGMEEEMATEAALPAARGLELGAHHSLSELRIAELGAGSRDLLAAGTPVVPAQVRRGAHRSSKGQHAGDDIVPTAIVEGASRRGSELAGAERIGADGSHQWSGAGNFLVEASWYQWTRASGNARRYYSFAAQPVARGA